MQHNKTWRWRPRRVFWALLAGAILILAGCGQPAATPTPEGPTAQTLADAGRQVYADHCASCHGEQGEGVIGPTLLGDKAGWAHFGTAQALYDYVHVAMPQDAPGSLSDQQYLEVVAMMLLDRGYVEGNAPLDQQRLPEISLAAQQ